MSDVFGKAKFGGSGRNWYKLKDGQNGPYRILPPMGDLREDGRWSSFYSIHYGYKNSAGEMRTFQSPQIKNRKTKMIEVPDAALDRINQLKGKLDAAKAAGDTSLVTKLLELVGGKKSRYNLDSNHYMNVIDLQGNIGILKIRHRAKLALDALIKQLRDQGIEPLSPEAGRFFTFSRSGMGMDTIYQVSVYKEKLNVEGVGNVERDVVHAITTDLAKRCCVRNENGTYTYKEAGRLDRLFKTPTAEQVARFVTEGETAIDEILDAKTNDGTSNVDESGLEEDDLLPTTPTTQTNTVTSQVTVTAPVVTPTPATTQPAVVAAPVAAPTPTPVVTPVQSNVPKTTAQNVTEMTNEEFLKSIGL